MKEVFKTIFYEPLYNGLIFLMDIIPWADAGIAVVLLTILVKFILFPLSKKAIITQLKMKAIEGELASLREKHKSDRAALAKATMELYRTRGVNPFSSFFIVLLQIPIILALYYVFYKGGLPTVNQEILYPFVSVPTIDMHFLGLIDISGRSLFLALAAGVTQYIQMALIAPLPPKTVGEEGSFQAAFAKSMHLQMRYVMPLFITFVAYSISGAVALYWTTSNIFAIAQEAYLRRKFKQGVEERVSHDDQRR